jgi:hypothetical protein
MAGLGYIVRPCPPLKKNPSKLIMSFAGKWMELENIMLSKISQIQK